MRRWDKIAIVLIAGVLGLTIFGRADGKEARGIISIVEFIEVPQGIFSDHISANPLKSDARGLRKTVQVWVVSGKAKVSETLIVNTLSGQSGKSEAVREVFYPESFTPPHQESKKSETKKEDKEEKQKEKGKTMAPAVPPASTEFRAREVGGFLEVKPTIKEDGTISVSVQSEFSARLDNSLWEVNEKSGKTETPTFHSANVTTRVEMKNGGYAFLGTSQLPDERRSNDFEDSILLIFLRADSF